MKIRFEKDETIILHGVHYALGASDEDGTMIAPIGSAANPRSATHKELVDAWFAGHLTRVRAGIRALSEGQRENIGKPLEAFSGRSQTEALRRFDYVRIAEKYLAAKKYPRRPDGFRRIGRIASWLRRRERARELGIPSDSLPLERVGGSTLREWYRHWQKSGRHICALIPLHERKGRHGKRLDPEVVRIIQNQVQSRYLVLERPPLTLVYQLILAAIERWNESRAVALPVPSLSSVRRWLKENIDDYDLVYHRKGKRAAEQEFRNVHRAPRANRPLEIVEIDHTRLDIQLVSDTSSADNAGKKSTHGVWLTVGICSATRMIVGWYLSPTPPAWTSVMACLGMAILPKDMKAYGVHSEYPVFGVPEVVVVDNGKEFHSHSLKAAQGQLRFEVRYAPRRKPHLKGKVERVIGTIKRDFLAFLPGRTFADPRERGDYPSTQKASLTLRELERLFGQWVCDIYHIKPHGGLLGETPLRRWQELAKVYGTNLPANVSDLHAILALNVHRKISTKGVEFLGLLYQSDNLQQMRRHGSRVGDLHTVKVDPHDIGDLIVLDERAGRWLNVPCLYPELAEGTTMAQWKEITRIARRSTAEGRRVSYSTLLRTRQNHAEEARRKGAAPIRMTKSDIDWFREHVDDPIFHFEALSDGDRADEPDTVSELDLTLSSGIGDRNVQGSEINGETQDEGDRLVEDRDDEDENDGGSFTVELG